MHAVASTSSDRRLQSSLDHLRSNCYHCFGSIVVATARAISNSSIIIADLDCTLPDCTLPNTAATAGSHPSYYTPGSIATTTTADAAVGCSSPACDWPVQIVGAAGCIASCIAIAAASIACSPYELQVTNWYLSWSDDPCQHHHSCTQNS